MRRSAVLSVCAIVLVTSACSEKVEVLDSPYRAEFDAALGRVTTDFERSDECGLVTIREIEPLKRAIEANPQNLDREQAIIDCLVDAEVAPRGSTVEDLGTYLSVDGADAGDPLAARTDAIDECVSSAAQ